MHTGEAPGDETNGKCRFEGVMRITANVPEGVHFCDEAKTATSDFQFEMKLPWGDHFEKAVKPSAEGEK